MPNTDNDKLFRLHAWLMVRICLVGIVAIAVLGVVVTVFDVMPEQFPTGRATIAAVGLIALLPLIALISIRCERYIPGALTRYLWGWLTPIAYMAVVVFVVWLVYH